MKYLRYIIICLLGFIHSVGQSQNPLIEWETLPILRKGVKIRAYSSHNPSGRTYRDFRNYTLKDESGYEMANQQGSSGMLVGIWFTSLEKGDVRFGDGLFGDIKLHLSNPEFPDFIKQREMYFTQSVFPNLQPLWGTAGGAQWAFPCLPFGSFFMASSTEAPHWYQFTTHLYREARFNEWVNPTDLKKANELLALNPFGYYPGMKTGFESISGSADIKAGTGITIFKSVEPGVIRAVYLTMPDLKTGMADDMQVILFTDGIKSAEVPLSVFFGAYPGAPLSNAKGLPCGFDGERFYFFFPLPFWQNCRIELVNNSGVDVPTEFEVLFSMTNPYAKSNAGHFFIQYNNSIFRKAGEPDFPHLAVNGTGHIVGAIANLAGSIEGNFRIYVDDAKTPAIETTGGEDYFCHAFGIDVGLVTPFHGGLNDKIGYRFHIADYIPFQKNIFFGQDHGHSWSHDTDGTFRSAVFYYLNPQPSLELTDSLDVGNLIDEKKHAFGLTGINRIQHDTSAYEGNFNTPFEDAGRWLNGEMSFRAGLNPSNDGVRLRRRINQLSFHQNAEVWIDGTFVGKWFEKGSNYELLKEPLPERHPGYQADWQSINNRFRDTEFEIPASLTQGKSTIAISLRTVGSKSVLNKSDEGHINAYKFWVYCYKD